MKTIPLTKGMGYTKVERSSPETLIALVDDEDFDYLNQWKWKACRTVDGNIYARRFERNKGQKNGKIFTMHRVILRLAEGIGKIDHWDMNGLNNQKGNLRTATDHQNGGNRDANSNNTSGYKGVTWCKCAKKWQAQIMVHREHKYLGLFEDPADAASEYDKAALVHFGGFARTNKQLGRLN